MALVKLLGNTVVGGDGNSVDVSGLAGEGKAIGIYFSAHWCGPCRSFTPKLADFYKKMKAGEKGSKLEIVFVSSDKDQKSFDDYFKEMPWHALPYDEREKKKELSGKYKVRGIPTLVFVDGQTGKLLTADGRGCVQSDEEGKEFPWRDKGFLELMPGKVTGQKDEQLDFEKDLQGKILGVYFSAHWCPPCRGFTPELVKFYNKKRETDKDFEIIFVSSDRDDASFNDYFKEMPWTAVPYGDSRKDKLSKLYSVSGIPTLVWVDKDGKTITTDGRSCVSGDPDGKEFPWYPKPVNELSGSKASIINESPCLIYFSKEDDDSVEKAKDALKPSAQKVFDEAKSSGDDQKLYFFHAKADEEIIESLTEFAGLGSDFPLLAILDVSSGSKYVSDNKEPNDAVVTTFVDDYLAGKLMKLSIR